MTTWTHTVSKNLPLFPGMVIEIDGKPILKVLEYDPERGDLRYESVNYHVIMVTGIEQLIIDNILNEKGKTSIKETTFLERLITEEKELGKKIIDLNNGLNSVGFYEKVGDYQFYLLNLQYSAMITYRRVLLMRIKDLTNLKRTFSEDEVISLLGKYAEFLGETINYGLRDDAELIKWFNDNK
ncbi:hypothetical protein M0Q97_11505 [Candidatus Dojkabacteria bacterium]|jgi:hypothetical protein|nr:hypothetical protein [Candidatus Dojkabacteria bacterium]